MRQYIVGNWKMNGTKSEALKLASGFLKRIQEANRPLPQIVLCPSFLYIIPVIDILKGSPIDVGAQDCHPEKGGPFTGDVSVTQLVDIGCKYVILGHSERRYHHHEDSLVIRRKVSAAIEAGLRPILCVGESLEERKKGKALHSIAHQLQTDLPVEFSPERLVVAYEPLWAIGTGVTPKVSEIEEAMGLIKHELAQRVGGGGLVPTLYGGSVNAKNAQELLSISTVDGLLVGGVSLNLEEFWEVINQSWR